MLFLKKRPGSGIIIGLICILTCMAATFTSFAQEDPTISLVKTIIIRDYKGLKVSSDEYVVQPDDFVLKILKQRGVVKELIVQREILDLIRTLNPDLEDPNKIYPGQKLILPIGPIKGLRSLEEQPAPAPARKTAQISPDTKIPYRLQRVRQGERLVLYLRREGIPERLIFNEYMNLVMKLNPQIKNRNLIYPGQVIKIPVLNPSMKAALTVQIKSRKKTPEKITATAQLKTPEKKPQPPRPVTVKKPEAKPQPRPKKEKVAALPPPKLPESEALVTRAALGIIFTRIGEQFISTGQHFLPLKSGGQVTLNTSSFPIIKLRNGHRIILDLGRRLPEQVIRLIRAEWSGYTIFQTKPRENLKELLERLFKECNYPKIHEKGQPVIISQTIKIKLEADWIIFPQEEDLAANQPVVLNLLSSRRMGTFPEAAAYLADQKVRVIDFYPQGNLIGPEPLASLQQTDKVLETITSKNSMSFLMALLELLGQKFTVNLSIPVIKDAETEKNFSLSVHIPLYFSRNGTDYLVRQEDLSKDLTQILEQQGAKVIVLHPNEDAIAAARTILSAVEQDHKWGLVLKASPRPSDRNVEFTIPGLIVNTSDEPLFLTPLEIPLQLLPLLAKKNIRTIRFLINKSIKIKLEQF